METSKTVHYSTRDDNEQELPEFFIIEMIDNTLDQYEIDQDFRYTKVWIVDDDSDQGFAVTVEDDTTKRVRKKHVGVPEGQSREYQIWMTAPPIEPVTVDHQMTGSDSHLTSSSPSSYTFDTDNCFEPYRITIDAAQDSDTVDGLRISTHTVTTDDPVYEDESPRFVLVTERDNDGDPMAARPTRRTWASARQSPPPWTMRPSGTTARNSSFPCGSAQRLREYG